MPETEKEILIVEDEPDVRFVVSEALQMEGFKIVEAANSAEALTILQSNPNIVVLFTDIVMPGEIDGFELAHRAKQLRPDLAVIYTSGYVRNLPWGKHGVGYGPLLPKPYKHQHLFTEIRRALHPGSTSIQ